MTIWEAFLLGLIQGLTEFLPVSSSGHLELANYLFGIEEPNNLRFTMLLHAGTVLSTIVVFWSEIVKLFKGLFEFKMNSESRFVINLLISAIPVAIVGLLFQDWIETLYTSNIFLVGIMLLVTAGLLTLANYSKPGNKPIDTKRALIIGISQAIAIFPGLSRSGTTIATGMLLGVKREEVSKFSFLMVLIPILGMNLLELLKGDSGIAMESALGFMPLIVGFLAAFISGAFACKMMIRLVNKGNMIWFAIYCIVVGSGAIVMSFM